MAIDKGVTMCTHYKVSKLKHVVFHDIEPVGVQNTQLSPVHPNAVSI